MNGFMKKRIQKRLEKARLEGLRPKKVIKKKR